MSEILDYYLALVAKPIAQMTLIDLLSLAALPVSFFLALILMGVVLGRVIQFFEWSWPSRKQNP